MEEKRILYSKKFKREDFSEIEEKHENLGKEIKMPDEMKDGESFLDFIKKNQKAVPNKQRIEEKDLFIKAVIDLAESYQIDTDMAELDTHISAHIQLPIGPYMGRIKKILSGIFVMADEFDIFPPVKEDSDEMNIMFTYHTHDIYLNDNKITDLDWED